MEEKHAVLKVSRGKCRDGSGDCHCVQPHVRISKCIDARPARWHRCRCSEFAADGAGVNGRRVTELRQGRERAQGASEILGKAVSQGRLPDRRHVLREQQLWLPSPGPACGSVLWRLGLLQLRRGAGPEGACGIQGPDGRDWRAELEGLADLAAEAGKTPTDILDRLRGFAECFGPRSGNVNADHLRQELARFQIYIPAARAGVRRPGVTHNTCINASGQSTVFHAQVQHFRSINIHGRRPVQDEENEES